jgi:hypothetical protein
MKVLISVSKAQNSSKSSSSTRKTTSSVDAWAAEMLKVASKVKKLSAADMSSQDGIEVSTKEAKALIAAFKAAGYKPYDQIDDFYVIESKKDSSVGISIDMRADEYLPKGKAIVQFYNNED